MSALCVIGVDVVLVVVLRESPFHFLPCNTMLTNNNVMHNSLYLLKHVDLYSNKICVGLCTSIYSLDNTWIFWNLQLWDKPRGIKI